ncbi:MAG TPA: fatty acid--CoA ligase family protein [Rhodopila sp.]|nr:fatty acid--CoA ligase family protein [Rhodopila sp.]
MTDRHGGTPGAILWHARRTPHAVAVVEAGRRLTWQAVADQLAWTVGYLEAGGIRRGMLVGVEMGSRRHATLLLLLACEVLGATATAFARPDLGQDDPVLPGCERLILIGTELAADGCPGRPSAATVIVPNDFPDMIRGPVSHHRLSEPPDAERIVRISRTSGSTGRPKAVPITYAVQQRIIAQRMASVPEDVAAKARFLCLYSLSVRGVYTRAYAALQAGGTVFFAHREDLPALLAAGAVNWVLTIVGDAQAIAVQADRPCGDATLLYEMIGARVPRALRALLRRRLGATVQVTYSSNETNTVSFTDDDDVGTLVPGAEARIVDAEGRAVPMGETGLIRVRTATMATGYWNDPVQTAAAFVDGWYHTNDVGFIPAPGRLVVHGRSDDMLNVGGIKVPPGPIEDELKALPDIRDAALISIAGPTGDDTLLVAAEVGADVSMDGLRAAVGPIVQRYVQSFALLPLPSFPRTDTGKIRRGEIEAAFRRRLT